MNLYDPSDGIRYVHLSGPASARSDVPETTGPCTALPSGYANQSPGTRLRRPTVRPDNLPRSA